MHTNRITQLEQILAENPNNTFALFALAKEYEKHQNFILSIQLFEKLIVIDELYIGAYYHLAKIYAQIDEVNKALNIYEQGIFIAQRLNDLHSLSELKNAKMNLELEM
ncbi:MAG TPA: hypothetical protein PLJ42_10385 [Chitinophagales bacterium]|jgi:tetratricopeptide (TPR) repeat protein|nr:hypothetical protein [Chitinophagales bacterium]MBP6155086.1 hypothetical protein [Chitinophagales bacterium]HQV79048.1 hypothetical protein [Chitinophagales bacterium]HQW79829.1 hypothetical protein [Chitinophagales bacterium]HRB67661.1 hypothetical protein [Chitinophagales bacterium]